VDLVRLRLAPRRFLPGLALRALGAALALALAAPWAAAALPIEWDGPPPPVRLVAPAPGEVLAGGGTAEIAWEPTGPLGEGVVEWEAFLSLDGGATYPVRITPHLDVALRRASFRVPALASREVRLLLRFGDERREASLPVAHRFAIAPASPGAFEPPPAQVLGAGEPALPGAAGVVAWAEGTRQGGATRQVAGTAAAGLRPGFAVAEDRPQPALGSSPTDGSELEPAALHPRVGPPTSDRSRFSRPAAPRPAGADLLLLLKRRNE
jgi:hypothetical protein